MKRNLARILLLLAAASPAPLAAQPAATELPAEAHRRLHAIIGTWDSKWSWLDREGNVARSAEGTEQGTWAIEGRVVLLTTEIPALESRSQAFMYYSELDQLFHLVSVDQRGDRWILSGGLEEYVITSEPKPRPRGGELIIRFTHHEADDDHFSAVMETSIDGGETWRESTHQELVRRSPAAPGNPSGAARPRSSSRHAQPPR